MESTNTRHRHLQYEREARKVRTEGKKSSNRRKENYNWRQEKREQEARKVRTGDKKSTNRRNEKYK